MDSLESLGAMAPLAFIGAMALAIVVAPIPSVPLTVASGMAFGPFLGGVYSLVGALSGAAIAFSIARLFGREIIERVLGREVIFYPKCADRVLVRIVFISRLLPIVSFDVVSYGAGLSQISFLRFALATLVGMVPFTFIYAYYGTILFVRPWVSVILGLVFLALFVSLPAMVKRYNLFNLKKYFSDAEDC